MATVSAANGIKATNKALMDAIKAGDAAAAAKCYTSNAILMPPGAKACKTLKSIEAFWGGAIKSGVTAVNLRTTKIEVHGGTAIEYGSATLKGPRGKTLDNAKFVVVWKKKGKNWKLHIDIFNSNG